MIDRFLDILIDSVDLNGCWNWQGNVDNRNYGRLYAGKTDDGKMHMLKAHIVSYEYVFGPVPKGLEVCHNCDNPQCVRPDHLKAATHKQNMMDAAARGRAGRPPSNICLRGHDLSVHGVYDSPLRRGGTTRRRRCRKCKTIVQQQYRAANTK